VTGTAGRLGIDFGTSTTVAVVRRPDGRTRPLYVAYIKADRIAEGGWSRATRDKIEAAFLASAKATYAKLAVR
jgi:hypothetical protein